MYAICKEKQSTMNTNHAHHERRSSRRSRLLNSLDEIRAVREEIASLLESLEYSNRDIHAVQLSLEEALVNAFQHGNRLDPEKQVHISYRVTSGQAWFRVEDEGDGFAVDDVPNPTLPENLERPCGRGVFLMRSYLDLVEFNPAGNVVRLCKFRSQDN